MKFFIVYYYKVLFSPLQAFSLYLQVDKQDILLPLMFQSEVCPFNNMEHKYNQIGVIWLIYSASGLLEYIHYIKASENVHIPIFYSYLITNWVKFSWFLKACELQKTEWKKWHVKHRNIFMVSKVRVVKV